MKRFFTLVELMLGVSISSIVFIVLMGLVLNVSLVVRDLYADYLLTNHARFVRYVLINGVGPTGGFSSAKGEFTKAGQSKIFFNSVKSSDYVFGHDLATNGQVSVDVLDSMNFADEILLPPTITVLEDSLSIETLDCGYGHEIFVRSYLGRRIWGRDYEFGIMIRSLGTN